MLPNDQLTVKITERVTLHGKYDCSPEEYPEIQAARWALSKTDGEAVRQAIEQYIRSVKDDLSKSSGEEGFEITFILRHHLVIAKGKNGLQIVEDTFTDRNPIDNLSGTDNVIWRDGRYFRNKPDLTEMPDYQLYAIPIEKLGQNLLNHYTEIYGGQTATLRYYYYSHSAGAAYINSWTSNTTSECWKWWLHILEDQSKWNPGYSHYACEDCANYVSQALSEGGMAQSSTWRPNTVAWINAPKLKEFIEDDGRGQMKSNLSDLSTGDIAFISDFSHVVMVAAKGPYRYSAHTHDRWLHSWVSDLNKYMRIFPYPLP
ncbi:MAG: amidase domain-containing protein [Chloroflexota bacterium]|nr:amidase domain-containing protein [Chloroflexota bacterium]